MDNYPLNMDTNLLCPENLDMLYSKMGKLLEEFGEYLTSLRTAAGFSSLDSVAKAAKGKVTKSRLSLYERGEVKTIKPETLRALAKLYGVAYELLAGRWFEAQYQVSPISLSEDSIIKESSVEKCTFRGSKENRGEDFDVISLSQLEFLQTKLPKGSQVGVASIDFLDDTIFFDMVSENINRGVSYRYLMPEDQQAIYMSFLSKLNEKYPKLKGRLDGKLTEFVPRANLDFPVNYILYIYPDGEIKGFVGLMYDSRVQYMQVADRRLSWRLYDGFRWAMTIAKDREVSRALSNLVFEVGHCDKDSSKKTLKQFI